MLSLLWLAVILLFLSSAFLTWHVARACCALAAMSQDLQDVHFKLEQQQRVLHSITDALGRFTQLLLQSDPCSVAGDDGIFLEPARALEDGHASVQDAVHVAVRQHEGGHVHVREEHPAAAHA